MYWLWKVTAIVFTIVLMTGHGAAVLAITDSEAPSKPSITVQMASVEDGLATAAAGSMSVRDCAASHIQNDSVVGHSSGSCHTLIGLFTASATWLSFQGRANPILPTLDAEFGGADLGLDTPPPRLIAL